MSSNKENLQVDNQSRGSLNGPIDTQVSRYSKIKAHTQGRVSETQDDPIDKIQAVVIEAISARERGQSMNQIETYLDELSAIREDM